ncbi:MAG TPA: SRPBCC family protein [Trebonia sp.]|jgi:carbon monoxide dehydrogenase subunit G
MPVVSRSFRVDPAPSTVVRYLSDFGNAEEWDPGTVSCTRTDAGPVRVGASWRNVSRFAGRDTELSYTLERLTADTIVFVGRNKGATSTDTIAVAADGAGSKVTYRAHLALHGAAALLSPAVKLIFEKVATDTVRQLTVVLNALP